MVSVLLDWQNSARPSWYRSIDHCPANMWGPARFCTWAHPVHHADLVSVVEQHGLSPHLYADDTQIYGFCPSFDVGHLVQDITGCVDAVGDCMSSNRLQLNGDKTELMWLTTARRQQRLPTLGLTIGSTLITPEIRLMRT